jgi:hypothetical protein
MNSAQQKELRAKVHEALLPFYEPQGFKLNRTNGVFEKDEFEVSWGVKRKYVDCIYFNPSLRISNSNIQKSLEKIFADQKFGLTISRLAGCHLAQEFGVHEYDYVGDNEDGVDHGTTYKVDHETDLAKIVADHVNYMEKVGLPFFEKLSSIEGIYDYLSGLLFNNDNVRRIIGKREVLSCVTAGYLLNHPSIDSLLQRLEVVYNGNNVVLNDVRKIEEYFKSQS